MKAMVLEHKESYEEALEILKIAPKFIYNDDYMNYCKDVQDRIKKKSFAASKEVKKEDQESKEETETPKPKRFGFLF